MPTNVISTRRAAGVPNQSCEAAFRSMRLQYDRFGGLATGEEVVALMRSRADQPLSIVARRILGRSMVNFSWHSQFLVPLFQFDREDMSLCPGMQAVIGELVDSFDDWDLASWFVTANTWIGGDMPAQAVKRRPRDVLDAARADRFIARG